MISAAFDIGVTTGIAVATVSRRATPYIHHLSTINLRDFSDDQIAYQFGRLYQLFSQVHIPRFLIVEWPANDKFSKGNPETSEAAYIWKTRFFHYFEHRPTVATLPILPSQWKSSLSNTIPQYCKNLEELKKGRSIPISRHEQDAARILHWFAYFSKML